MHGIAFELPTLIFTSHFTYEGIHCSKSSWINRSAVDRSCDEWQSSGKRGFVDSEMVQIYMITNGLELESNDIDEDG